MPGVEDLGGGGHCSSGGWAVKVAGFESATVE